MNAVALARILIVDDDAAAMRALCDTLRDQGYETEGFTAGAEALRVLRETPFDLLLTDLVMPEMDGVALLTQALQIDPQLVGVLMTGKGTIETAVQAMQAGALDCVLKPIKLNALLPVLARALAVRRLRLENVALQEDLRKRTEEELNHINRALNAISQCNSAVIRSVNEYEFLTEFCDILVKNVGFRMVWVGQAMRDEAHTVRPIAEAGFVEGYLERIRVTWADNEFGRGPVGTAIRTGRPSVIQNILTNPAFAPWRKEASAHGYAAVAALPLTVAGEMFGSLNLYAPEPDSFDEREMALLNELAIELTHGIEFLKSRKERENVQAALRENEALLRLFIEHAPAAIAMFDRDMRYLAISRRWLSHYKPGEQNIIGRSHYEVFPDIPQRWRDVHRRCLAGASESCDEDRFERADGSVLWLSWEVHPWRQRDGKVGGIVMFTVDITERKRTSDELQMRLEQQAAIARLGQFALLRRNPATIETEAAAILARTLDVEYSKVLKKIPDRNALLLRAGVGWRAGLVGHATMEIEENTQASYTLQSKAPVVVEDISQENRFKTTPLFTEHATVSGMSIIIGDTGNPLGILGVHSTKKRKFTHNDIHFLEAIANILAESHLRFEKEQLLAQTEQRYSHLINSSPSVIYATSVAKPHRCNFVSNTIKVVGIEPEEMQSDPNIWPTHVHPEDLPRVIAEVEDHVGRGGGTVEYRFRCKQGEYCWISDNFRVVGEEIIGSWTDVTAFREAENKAKESEERFRTVAVASNDIIYERNPATNEVKWYGNMGVALGYGPGEFDQTLAGWESSIHPEDRERVLAAVERYLRDPSKPFSEEYRIRAKDGSYRFWTDRGMIVKSADKTASKWIGACADITEKKLMEQQLAQSQKMEAVGQLTGGVAHDFNNRLTAIIGNLELLERRLKDDPTALRFIRGALTAAEGGAELTKNLLSFSRKQVLDTQVFNVNELVRGMYDLFLRTLGETIEIDMALAADLLPVRTDRNMLENVLLNLAINARDAMPGGGVLTLETANCCVLEADHVARHACVNAGEYILMAVGDTGMGMSEEVRRHAFEPFFTTKERGKGTGLGLSMAYGFAKQSNGHIEIYSEPGHGTSVKLYLPRHETSAEEDAAAASAAAPAPSTWGRLHGQKVLAVEDDPLVLSITTAVLTEMGCEVIAADNGPAALECFTRVPDIDLLFTDVVMPGGMTGVELAQRLRAQRPGLKVLYTSGYTPQAAANHIARTENDFWLAKPYRAQALKEIVRRALNVEAEQ